MNITSLAHPAHIVVGNHTALLDTVMQSLQAFFCSQHRCGVCSTCHQIRIQQFYGITWLNTEKQYSLDDLEFIFTTIAYRLTEGQHHFFIIQKAELLTSACSNSLLKIVEEPPIGYHLIFLTQNLSTLLPTIRSRCIVHTYANAVHTENVSSFLSFFKYPEVATPSNFLKILEQEKIQEQESVVLLDELLVFWIDLYKKAQVGTTQQAHASAMVNIIQQALQEPPMPGSTKIFWRNLYLQMMNITDCQELIV